MPKQENTYQKESDLLEGENEVLHANPKRIAPTKEITVTQNGSVKVIDGGNFKVFKRT